MISINSSITCGWIILWTTATSYTMYTLNVKKRLEFWCLTPLSTKFQLYYAGQFYWWMKPEYPEKTLSHNVVSSTPRLSAVRTHNVRGDRH